jgi:hypothetical protein
MVFAAFSTSTAATLSNTIAGNVNLLPLKNHFIHLIHQAGLSINRQTEEDVQPYMNVAKHFQMLSEMSINNVKTIGLDILLV